MFLGTFNRTIDDKGRFIIPSKFREELADGLIISIGLNEKCLFVFPKEEWKSFEEKVKSLPMTKKDAQGFARWFLSQASDEILDQQGRITIPGHLKEYAGLDKDIVIVGVSGRLEIWDRGNWEEFYHRASQRYAEISEDMTAMGF